MRLPLFDVYLIMEKWSGYWVYSWPDMKAKYSGEIFLKLSCSNLKMCQT